VDRKKELIKVNGLQVAPAELEAVLLEHPDVADAAVVGITVRDEEFPRGYVVLQNGKENKVTPEDIQNWVKPRIAKHKHFKGGIVFVDEIPKLASGKIVRKLLKEWAKKAVPEMERKIKARL
jgi:4-coumarate--CoA ligase